MRKDFLSWERVFELVDALDVALLNCARTVNIFRKIKIHGVPRGGSIVAGLLLNQNPLNYEIVSDPKDADFIIDDIIDSGATRERYSVFAPVLALIDKTITSHGWVVFPWEGSDSTADEEDTIRRLLQQIGSEPERDGLKGTPARVVKFYKEFLNVPEPNLTTFKNDGYDEMIVQSGIQFYSLCEHHLLPFFGTATIAYIPGEEKIVGLSKLSRVVDFFANRLQNQERITKEIAEYLQERLNPRGVAVVLTARHLCMEMRGVEKVNAPTTTSTLIGMFKNDAKCRSEFLSFQK